MALTDWQQAKKLITESKYILIAFPPGEGGDAMGSAVALKLFLDKLNKQTDIASAGFAPAKNLKFLTTLATVKPELAHLQKFIIRVDTTKAPLDTLSYDVKDGWLSIYLTPRRGFITKRELRTAQSTFRYDLIITLKATDLDSLGDIFANNTDLFYRVPIINIDCLASNDRHGQVNLIDLNAAAAAEVVFSLLKEINASEISAEIATALLAGLIMATHSFRSPHLTPASLRLASELITLGANRERIIQELYRTRSVATLKLWGRALLHLEARSKIGLVFTTITRDDFARSGATAEDLKGVAEELISNSPEAKITLMLYEEPNAIGGLLTVDHNFDAIQILRPILAAGNKRQATFTVEGKNLKAAEEMVLKLIEDKIK